MALKDRRAMDKPTTVRTDKTVILSRSYLLQHLNFTFMYTCIILGYVQPNDFLFLSILSRMWIFIFYTFHSSLPILAYTNYFSLLDLHILA